MTYQATHATLDEALQHILTGLHGHNTVEREDGGRYVTFIDGGLHADVIMWEGDGPNMFGASACDDHTPVMEPAQSFDPGNLRFYFPQIEEFESGEHESLGFDSHSVEAMPEDVSDEDIASGMFDYDAVGWMYTLHIG